MNHETAAECIRETAGVQALWIARMDNGHYRLLVDGTSTAIDAINDSVRGQVHQTEGPYGSPYPDCESRLIVWTTD